MLAKLHTNRSMPIGGEGGVNPRTARALIARGYAFTWACGEFDPYGPFVHINAKRNDTGHGREDGFVRTLCSCNAGVLALKCELCGGAAERLDDPGEGSSGQA